MLKVNLHADTCADAEDSDHSEASVITVPGPLFPPKTDEITSEKFRFYPIQANWVTKSLKCYHIFDI